MAHLGLKLTLDKGLETGSESNWLKAVENYEDGNDTLQALGAHRNLSKEFIHFTSFDSHNTDYPILYHFPGKT